MWVLRRRSRLEDRTVKFRGGDVVRDEVHGSAFERVLAASRFDVGGVISTIRYVQPLVHVPKVAKYHIGIYEQTSTIVVPAKRNFIFSDDPGLADRA